MTTFWCRTAAGVCRRAAGPRGLPANRPRLAAFGSRGAKRRFGTAWCLSLVCLLLLPAMATRAGAVELTVSRAALERTLRQQLFSGPGGRYYLKGNAQSACFTYVQDPQLSFEQDRIVVHVKTVAHLGQRVGGACLGFSLSTPAEVSLAPDAQGESIGFRDAQIDRVSEQKELNFLLLPFLRHQIPSSMKVNAAGLLRQALTGSTASTGYTVSLDRLKIHSVVIQGDTLIVDADGDLSVK